MLVPSPATIRWSILNTRPEPVGTTDDDFDIIKKKISGNLDLAASTSLFKMKVVSFFYLDNYIVMVPTYACLLRSRYSYAHCPVTAFTPNFLRNTVMCTDMLTCSVELWQIYHLLQNQTERDWHSSWFATTLPSDSKVGIMIIWIHV